MLHARRSGSYGLVGVTEADGHDDHQTFGHAISIAAPFVAAPLVVIILSLAKE